jgi:hypothetical protein
LSSIYATISTKCAKRAKMASRTSINRVKHQNSHRRQTAQKTGPPNNPVAAPD